MCKNNESCYVYSELVVKEIVKRDDAIIKAIFIFFTGLYALAKMVDGMNNKYINSKDKIINLIEIVVSVVLTFIIFKI